VPAAAVIPAPIAYIKVVAVKTLVVGLLSECCSPPHGVQISTLTSVRLSFLLFRTFYFEKIRMFQVGFRLNTTAWNNKIGLWFLLVGS
jgi:hypothetical protein